MKKKKDDKDAKDDDEKIIIRLWPKTPVLYPMALLALICGIVGQIFGVPEELHKPKKAPAQESAEVQPGPANTPQPGTPAQPETTPAEPSPPATGTQPVPPAEDVPAPVPDSETVPDPEGANTPAPLAFQSDDVDKSKSGLVNTILAVIFLAMLAFSLFVVCIDFEVRWSLLIFVTLLTILMSALVAEKMGYIELPDALSFFDNFTLYATPLFYYCVFGIWVLLMFVSAVIARLHYVKIEHNEVVYVSGVLETQKRLSTFRMHYTKEIQDVFEYWLPFVGSGRLVFTFPNEEQPLIMDNVLGINRVLKKLDKKSSTFQVRGVD